MAKRVAIFLPSLSGGGAEKVMLSLAEQFVVRGFECDIVIAITKGHLLNSVPIGVRLVTLNKKKTIHAIRALAHYLQKERPDVLLATVFTASISALLARIYAGTRLRVVTCEANLTELDLRAESWLGTLLNTIAASILYRHADAAIAI